MNSCPKIDKLIAYCLNLLEPSEYRLIEEHLKVCSHCQQKIEVEKIIEKELSTPFEPGEIENIVLQEYKIYKEFKTTMGIKYLLGRLLNSLLVIAITACFGILLNIFWVKIYPDIEKGILLKFTPETANLFSMIFLFACLLFAFRKKVLKFI